MVAGHHPETQECRLLPLPDAFHYFRLFMAEQQTHLDINCHSGPSRIHQSSKILNLSALHVLLEQRLYQLGILVNFY